MECNHNVLGCWKRAAGLPLSFADCCTSYFLHAQRQQKFGVWAGVQRQVWCQEGTASAQGKMMTTHQGDALTESTGCIA